jgi:ABC-type Na+ efflux pump permease subunit
MSTNKKEPGETLALILFVLALCVIGWTVFVTFMGVYYRAFHFMPRFFSFRPYYQKWQTVIHFPLTPERLQFLVIGVVIALVLFALGAIIKAINANTRQLQKIREDLRKITSK